MQLFARRRPSDSKALKKLSARRDARLDPEGSFLYADEPGRLFRLLGGDGEGLAWGLAEGMFCAADESAEAAGLLLELPSPHIFMFEHVFWGCGVCLL